MRLRKWYYIDNEKVIHSADHIEPYNDYPVYTFDELVAVITQSNEIYEHTVCSCCPIIRKRINEIKTEFREKALERIYNSIIRKAQTEFNMEAFWDEYGDEAVHIRNTHEEWIVSDVEILHDNTYTVVLYHKNLLNNRGKRSSSRYPDYHIQWKKRISVWRILDYINRHEAKLYSA